jgi:hypothetical protein
MHDEKIDAVISIIQRFIKIVYQGNILRWFLIGHGIVSPLHEVSPNFREYHISMHLSNISCQESPFSNRR